MRWLGATCVYRIADQAGRPAARSRLAYHVAIGRRSGGMAMSAESSRGISRRKFATTTAMAALSAAIGWK